VRRYIPRFPPVMRAVVGMFYLYLDGEVQTSCAISEGGMLEERK
jgi:hypothetical protein